jgi:hypothetical protein
LACMSSSWRCNSSFSLLNLSISLIPIIHQIHYIKFLHWP